MQEKFRNWLIITGRSENTAYSYATSINNISEHYSQQKKKDIDIYKINDINILNTINNDYSTSGQFSEFGYTGRGTRRNAIARYVEFFTKNIKNNIFEQDANPSELNIQTNQNFSYERDLQTSLCLQITELFPKYKIYGSNSEGIEYSINNRRIDVLLENIETKDLLIIELKSGEADYRVFGQISMYLGLLQEKFPNKNIKDIIIAGSMQDSLKQAVSITDKIKLKTYRMNIELEEA
jgi:hypothetical protein